MIPFKKVYGLLLGIVACVIIFQMASTARFFGAFINRFLPCTQDPASSFPCYGIYDITVLALAFVVGLILIGVVAFRSIQILRKRHEK